MLRYILLVIAAGAFIVFLSLPTDINIEALRSNISINSKQQFAKSYDNMLGISSDDAEGNLGKPFEPVPVPNELTAENIVAWANSLNICADRKNLIKSAVSELQQARYSLATGHNNWRLPSLVGQTIECTGFVAWCYNKIGFDVLGAPASSQFANSGYLVTDSLLPGDVVCYTSAQSGTSGHAGIYLGKTTSGHTIYVDAGSGAVPNIKGHSKLDTIGTWYIHPDMKVKDSEYYANNSDVSASETTYVVKDSHGYKTASYAFKRWNEGADKTIVIDPGHGPTSAASLPDFSTYNYYSIRGTEFNGETEEDFALDVGLKLKDLLANQGYDVIMTRFDSSDVVSNRIRAVMANEVEADIVINIHWNAGGPEASGPLRVTATDWSSHPGSVESDKCWEFIKPYLSQHIGSNTNSDYAPSTPIGFISVCERPTVYIETGFATNSNDLSKLVGEDNHQAIANAIYNGLLDYFGR